MNKNIFLIISIAILAVFSSQAQQSRYGFRMGLNYSDIDFEDDSVGIRGSDDARIGFAAGFFAQYYLSEKFSIQPELQYVAIGERTKVLDPSPQGGVSKDALKVSVLQLPVLLNFHIGKLTLSAGPQAGIRVWEWERSNDYETFQFSGVAGIGYDITDNVLVNLRGSFGLTDAIKTSDTESVFKATGVNHYLQFTIAYRL